MSFRSMKHQVCLVTECRLEASGLALDGSARASPYPYKEIKRITIEYSLKPLLKYFAICRIETETKKFVIASKNILLSGNKSIFFKFVDELLVKSRFHNSKIDARIGFRTWKFGVGTLAAILLIYLAVRFAIYAPRREDYSVIILLIFIVLMSYFVANIALNHPFRRWGPSGTKKPASVTLEQHLDEYAKAKMASIFLHMKILVWAMCCPRRLSEKIKCGELSLPILFGVWLGSMTILKSVLGLILHAYNITLDSHSMLANYNDFSSKVVPLLVGIGPYYFFLKILDSKLTARAIADALLPYLSAMLVLSSLVEICNIWIFLLMAGDPWTWPANLTNSKWNPFCKDRASYWCVKTIMENSDSIGEINYSGENIIQIIILYLTLVSARILMLVSVINNFIVLKQVAGVLYLYSALGMVANWLTVLFVWLVVMTIP